ncbi:unnamed protein product [Bursaphelenchus okinawaensis]|uniref:Uncharacterized protein n=1 Tax=Bursaphelenchus okinawaensis TaxID=465554 RepID=A0A811LL00_9BILA|nr:unnamed protein product [Bursaphelenchus okinawaensis]CAG9125920.1 unnamed protein product [Bursaphelenchus okinawaensis]
MANFSNETLPGEEYLNTTWSSDTDIPLQYCVYSQNAVIQAMAFIVVSNLIVLVIIGYLIYDASFSTTMMEVRNSISTCSHALTRTCRFSTYPVAVIMAKAEDIGMKREDVVNEYVKDSYQRRSFVYNVLGETPFTRMFLQSFPSQFMNSGFEGELLITKKDA